MIRRDIGAEHCASAQELFGTIALRPPSVTSLNTRPR